MNDLLEVALEALGRAIAPRLSPPAAEWLAAARRDARANATSLARHVAAAGRRVGRGRLVDPPRDRALRLFEPDGPILNPWSIEDAARVLLLLEACVGAPADAPSRLAAIYDAGSAAERIGALRALQLLPESAESTRVVRDALRANAVDHFAAAICENRYASRYLPDPIFFQAVVKCVFVGLRVDRIERIVERTTPELARMLYAYVTEREHAGRAVAPELWRLIALHPPEAARDRAEVARARVGR